MHSAWQAELALQFAMRQGRTILASRRQRGPLHVQRPFYPEGGETCHVYLLHPPAGIVGSDELSVELRLEPDAHGLVTTPAATRWYFSRGRPARLSQRASLADAAVLEWLPQENLFFDGAHARVETRIELEPSARFCGWEILGFGRPACGEHFRSGSIDFRFELHRKGHPLLLERFRSADGRLPGLRGHAAYATFLATGVDRRALDATREVLEGARETICGATLVGDVLVARGLAHYCEPLHDALERVWSAVRPLVAGRVAVRPRIWHT